MYENLIFMIFKDKIFILNIKYFSQDEQDFVSFMNNFKTFIS